MQTSTLPEMNLMVFSQAVLDVLTTEQAASPQVVAAITDSQGYTEDRLSDFFVEKLESLDEYEIDLLFSPQFTARIHQQEDFAKRFAKFSVSKHSVQKLAEEVEAQGHIAPLVVHPGLKLQCPLKAVMAERFMLSLGLHKPLHQDVLASIETYVPADLQGVMALYGRKDIFQFQDYRVLLNDVLMRVSQQTSLHSSAIQEALIFLVETIVTYKPKALEDLNTTLTHLIQSCQDDMATAETRSYFHTELLAGSAGSVDDMHEAEAVRANYAEIIRKAQALQSVIK
jgi:hypothetical protein